MAQNKTDQTTLNPDGSHGDDAFTAFAIFNDNADDAEARLRALETGAGGVGQDVAALKLGLQQESQARQQGDAAEALARQQADAALGVRVDAEHASLQELGARIVGKNLLINGDFQYGQRGATWAAATGVSRFFADRWIGASTGTTLDAGIATVPPGGGSAGPLISGSRAMMQIGVVSVQGSANSACFLQCIEGVAPTAGKKVTVSFKARASVPSFKIGVEFAQVFGSGPSASAPVVGLGGSITLADFWQRHTVTVELPSIAGKTIDGADFLQLTFWLDAGANNTLRSFNCGQKSGIIHVAEVQVEEGASATGFDRRHPALELLLCQRYYEKSYDLGTIPGTATRAGAHNSGALTSYLLQNPVARFSVRKRSTPVVAIYNTQDGSVGQLSENNTGGVHLFNKPAGADAVSAGGFEIYVSNGTGTPGNVERAHWTAEAEIRPII